MEQLNLSMEHGVPNLRIVQKWNVTALHVVAPKPFVAWNDQQILNLQSKTQTAQMFRFFYMQALH